MANGIELATAYVSLEVDGSGVDAGVRRSLSGVDAQADRVGKTSGKKMGAGISAGVLGAVGKMAGPIAAVFASIGIGRILGDAITAGSDFQQATGAVASVFKEDADVIRANAEKAAEALGLSRTEYMELATVLGAGLKNKGIADFTGQTEDLITIGADLAAQFGGSTSDAVDALASAMRGERDPIERYGVSINDAALKAEALRKGIYDGIGPLTEQEKALATLSLVAEQTADAQGTFAREADTYAGSQARLGATWDNLKTQLGTALLPVLTDLSQWFLNEGLPAIQEFGGWVRDDLWPALSEGWETVRPALEEFQTIIADAFGDDSSGNVKSFADTITQDIIPALSTFAANVLPVVATAIAVVITAAEKVGAVFEFQATVVRGVSSFLLSTFINIMETFQTMLEALVQVPGFGWAKTAAAKMQPVIDKAKGIKSAIDNIPKSKTVRITVSTHYIASYSSRFDEAPTGYTPGRAAGGPVRKGQPYIVGEKRPELFIPDQNGTIIPRVPESMGENRTYEQPINVYGDVRTQSVVEFEEEMYHRRRRAVLSAPGR